MKRLAKDISCRCAVRLTFLSGQRPCTTSCTAGRRRLVRHHRRSCLKASLKIRTPTDASIKPMMSENISENQKCPGSSCLVASPGCILENFMVSPVFNPTTNTQNNPTAARSKTIPATMVHAGPSGFELSFPINMALVRILSSQRRCTRSCTAGLRLVRRRHG